MVQWTSNISFGSQPFTKIDFTQNNHFNGNKFLPRTESVSFLLNEFSCSVFMYYVVNC